MNSVEYILVESRAASDRHYKVVLASAFAEELLLGTCCLSSLGDRVSRMELGCRGSETSQQYVSIASIVG